MTPVPRFPPWYSEARSHPCPSEKSAVKNSPSRFGLCALKKHLWNVLIGSQLHSGPKARLYTSLGPSPQVPCPKNNQGLKARSNAQSPV